MGSETPARKLLPPPPGTRLSAIATDWAIVKGLVDPTSRDWSSSWERLVTIYRPAMADYVRWRLRASGLSAPTSDDVDEVLQGFLAWAMSSGVLAKADRTVGPFRAWLQILLRRYVQRHLRERWRTPGGRHRVAVEDLSDDETPEAASGEELNAFDRSWVARLIEVSIERLERRHAPYAAVIREMVAAEREEREPAPLANRHLRHHARNAFRRCFADVLRETVPADSDVAAEWAELARYLP